MRSSSMVSQMEGVMILQWPRREDQGNTHGAMRTRPSAMVSHETHPAGPLGTQR